MPFAAALSTAYDLGQAIEEITSDALRQMNGVAPELALVFFSPHHGDGIETIARTITAKLQVPHLIGCQGESIIGNRREVENSPAMVLWLASWQGKVDIESFHLVTERTPDGPSLLGWPDSLFETNPKEAALLALGDPFTFPVAELFLPRMNEDYPGLPVLGGMSSGMSSPGEKLLIRNEEIYSQGAVGVLLRGPVRWKPIVSQGAKPIGEPRIITKGQDNVILEIGGEAPLVYMRNLYNQLPARDQLLCRQGALMMGLAMNEYRETFGRGDFLIRNLYRFDESSGALALADRIRVGQTVQFHLRDADAASEELQSLLRDSKEGSPMQGALCFSCNGRGMRMFPEPNHDASMIQNEVGPIPLAGFFAAGELGPVGGLNYIHGFTASVFLFE